STEPEVRSARQIPQRISKHEHLQRLMLDGSEAHLSAPEIRKILLGRSALEVHFEVHGREVRRRTPLEKGLLLFRKIRAILRAVGCGADVDETGVLAARVLVADRMADVRVPEYCVAGHDFRDRH